MKQETIDLIASQALNEIRQARIFKQGKIRNWQLNEQMYYGVAKKITEARASVQLARMQEFVHTLLSKIDNPLAFKFTKKKNSQTKRINRLNALRMVDQDVNNWDIKDLVGKKQGIIYGRAVYAYYADSIDGRYRAHLEPIDVYEFLIDPSCGGIDLEDARFLGSYSVIFDKKQLEEGVKSKDFNKKAVRQLTESGGNASQQTQEETNKQFRTYDQNTIGKKEVASTSDKYKFWRWFTTYEGDRYYLLMTNNGDCIKCVPIEEVLPVDSEEGKVFWPFWSWAAFPDLTEFWTPSYCDYVREIFMAQDVTVNQMLDNAEAINKPQKLVNVTAIENLAELKYRRDGIIKVKGDIDINKAFQTVSTPSINTPIELFNLLEGIHGKASGVNDQSKGVEDTQGKVGIYQGNEAATADRFGLLNKSYSFGYKRFARLWEAGVRANLIKRVAIGILGPTGVELEEVKRTDLFKKGDSFGVMVEASNAETLASQQSKEAKNAFLTEKLMSQKPIINDKKAVEMQAEIAGFTQEQIDELLDVSVYGNTDQMSDADADIENILLGEDVKPNRKANNAYKQHILSYMENHDRDLSLKQFTDLTVYMDSLTDIIMRNEARVLQAEMAQQPAQPMPQPMPQPMVQGMPQSPIIQ